MINQLSIIIENGPTPSPEPPTPCPPMLRQFPPTRISTSPPNSVNQFPPRNSSTMSSRDQVNGVFLHATPPPCPPETQVNGVCPPTDEITPLPEPPPPDCPEAGPEICGEETTTTRRRARFR